VGWVQAGGSWCEAGDAWKWQLSKAAGHLTKGGACTDVPKLLLLLLMMMMMDIL
jgi:hypothetical protein